MCVITKIFEVVLMTAGVMMFLMAGYRVVTYIRKNKKEK
jgi:hypothetical protein